MNIQETLLKKFENKKLEPIAYYFDSLAFRDEFIERVDNLTRGKGSSIEGVMGCTFPRELDEYEVYNHGFDGIIFDCLDDEVVVDIPTFRKYLRMACEVYWKEHPESREILEKYLARPQPPLEEGALDEWKRRRDAGEYPKPYSEFE